METRIKWVQDRTFLGESGSGNSIVIDGDPEGGGRNLGIRPMETLLMGLGGCTAYDVVDILERGRQAVDDCVIEIDATRADDAPKVFTKIALKYVITGRDLDPKKVQRAVDLSAEKYCSASIMLAKTAEITHEIEIVESGG